MIFNKIAILGMTVSLTGRANVSTTRFVYNDGKGSVMIMEIPKEIEAKKLKVVFNAQQGTAEITSESWISRNSETIEAQGDRESQVLERSSVLIEKIAEGAAKGALRGAMPVP